MAVEPIIDAHQIERLYPKPDGHDVRVIGALDMNILGIEPATPTPQPSHLMPGGGIEPPKVARLSIGWLNINTADRYDIPDKADLDVLRALYITPQRRGDLVPILVPIAPFLGKRTSFTSRQIG